MRFKKLRFALGLSLLFSVFMFMGQYVPTEESCFNCAMENVGFVDIYNEFDVAPMMVYLKGSRSSFDTPIQIAPLSYRSFYMQKDRYVWRAWWVNALGIPLEWDWGYVYVKPGSRAVIRLAPKNK